MQISDLKPNPKNPRKISEKQLKALKKALLEFGDLGCFVYNKRTDRLIGGHQRAKSFPPDSKIIIEHEPIDSKVGTIKEGYVECNGEKFKYREVDWDEKKEKAANIAANQHGGEFEISILSEWITELNALDFDMELTGFSEKELNKLIKPESTTGHTDEDSVPELPKEPVTKHGDIYQLGSHKLMCGDSTVITDIEKLIEKEKMDMVFTDPPYNVDYDPEARVSTFSKERLNNKLGKIKNDKKSPEAFRQFLDDVYSSLNIALKAGAPIYICHADTEGHHFRNAFIAQPWKMQSCLIWKKTVLCFGLADYQWIHEPILYGWKEGESHQWHGDRKQTTVFEFPTDHYNKKEADTDGYVHPTQKPVNLISYALSNSSKPNDNVIDLFGGSGSTMIACEKNSRRAFLMELDPKYCDVIVKRWENFTGQKAKLLSST